MSDLQSYESRMADLDLNCFASHLQSTHGRVAKTPFTKASSSGDVASHRMDHPFKMPQMRSFQDCDPLLRNDVGEEDAASQYAEPVHVWAPPATDCNRTPSSGLHDSVDKNELDCFDKPLRPKHNATSAPRKHPTIPTSVKPEEPKEHNEKMMVGVDFLQKLESKISDLESRVEKCERAPDSSASSSICDNEGSVDSVSNLGHSSIRPASDSRHCEDDIIICEPKVKKERRGAINVEGPSLTIVRWRSFSENGRLEVVDEGKLSSGVVEGLGNRPLLALIEDYQSNDKLWRKRVEIASPAFFELLKEVSTHHISDITLQEGVFHLPQPFMVLFLNRKQLTEYVETAKESSQAKEHARFILDFLKNEFSHISRVLDNFESMTPPNLVKYCDLWMLYRPGTTVYSRANGEWEAFVIESHDGMQVRRPSQDNCHDLTRLDIRAWSIDFDGEVYGRVWSIHCVAPFHGVRDISSLALVPEKFLPDGNAIRRSLSSRGKEFCFLQGQHCQESGISPSLSSRVIVDHLTYQRRNGWLISIDGKYGPTSVTNRSWKENRYSDWDISDEAFDRRPRRYAPQRSLVRHFEDEYCSRDYELEDIDKPEDSHVEPCRRYSTDRPSHIVVPEFKKYDLIQPDAVMDELTLILCPQHVRGFCLRDKVWIFLNVSQLKPVSFQVNAWNRLVLDEEYKDVLETMVSSHVEKMAVLRGPPRGKGLSILLHGEPGVGKTLTAESIAEHLGKPLFPVTCSDIGTPLARFDEKLEEISDYATKWGAILLFDEADVLIQARRDYECANLKRNDLVSSIVRFVKYYSGIVFITTNRISSFDEALMQRIDIALGLPRLDCGRRVEIWHNQIQNLLDDGTIDASQSADLRMLAQQKWSKDDINGHQIKRAVKNASVLAEKRGKMLGHREIETMLKMAREFGERAGHSEKKKEQDAGSKKDKEDLEGFEQVDKP